MKQNKNDNSILFQIAFGSISGIICGGYLCYMIDTKKYHPRECKRGDIHISDKPVYKKTSFIGYLCSFNQLPSVNCRSSINYQTYQQFCSKFNQLKPDEDLTIYLRSGGGEATWGSMICRMVANHKGKVTAIIEEYAFSMASMIALCCDKIKIGKNACMGMIDLNFTKNNVSHDTRTLINAEKKDSDKFEDRVLYNTARDIHNSSIRETRLLLKKRNYTTEQIDNIIDKMHNADIEHNYQFCYDELKDILGDRIELIS